MAKSRNITRSLFVNRGSDVDGSGPAYTRSVPRTLNPTHGSVWIPSVPTYSSDVSPRTLESHTRQCVGFTNLLELRLAWVGSEPPHTPCVGFVILKIEPPSLAVSADRYHSGSFGRLARPS